jgi:hypothetical protein
LGGVGPEGGRHFRGIASSVFQILDEIEQPIHGPILSGWATLTDKYMDRRDWMDARQNAADVANGQRFDDCQRAMLAVGRIPAPPDHAKYLAGAEVVNGTVVPVHLPTDGVAETKAIGH